MFNASYISKGKGGTKIFIDLWFMNIDISIWKPGVTKMKWSSSWCFKNKVYYMNRMRDGKLNRSSSIANKLS